MVAPRRVALAIVLGAGAIRLALAAVIQPFPDETYYWDWSRHLAPGYFDHPPMIALAIRAGTILFGATPIGIRVVPVLLGIVAVLAGCVLAKHLGGDKGALRAAIVLACLPLAGAGLVLATPDAPLLCFSAIALVAVERAVAEATAPRAAILWWAIAGLAGGLAMASKYTGILLPVGVVLALAIVPALRKHFATAGPYLAVALASLVMIPVLRWNAAHDWISFRFQLSHGLGVVRGTGIQREGELLGGQLGLATPILFVMFVIVIARAWRTSARPRERMLAIVATLIFAFFVYSAWRRPAEANWPALAYIPAVALLAATEGALPWRRWLVAGCVLGGVMVAGTYVQALGPVLPIAARKDPMARNAGFRKLGSRVTVIRDSLLLARKSPIIAAQKYQDASELAYWIFDKPDVLSINTGYRANQYDLWPGLRDVTRPGSSLIVVGPADGADSSLAANPGLAALAPHYHQVSLLGVMELGRGGSVRERKRIWLLETLNSPLP